MTVLSQGWQVQILNALVEGVSIRSTERMTQTHRDTIMRLPVAIRRVMRVNGCGPARWASSSPPTRSAAAGLPTADPDRRRRLPG
jgi:hypothetical protein